MSDEQLPIHQRYLLLVEHLFIDPPVLKTDLWNELYTPWPIPADIYIEIDKEMVETARKGGMNVSLCSITDMQLENESIRTILDFSTIDHVEDPFPALLEYHRVLMKGNASNCYIVCWIGEKAPEKMNNWDGYQFYFKKSDFVFKVHKSGFYIRNHRIFAGFGDSQSSLNLFHLKLKKKNMIVLRALTYFFTLIQIIRSL